MTKYHGNKMIDSVIYKVVCIFKYGRVSKIYLN